MKYNLSLLYFMLCVTLLPPHLPYLPHLMPVWLECSRDYYNPWRPYEYILQYFDKSEGLEGSLPTDIFY
jgi:hypothetical protein